MKFFEQGFKTKSLDTIMNEAGQSRHTLKRVLGPWDLTAIGIGCIIGTGIFVITGTAAATKAGPGIMLSFVIAALACTFAALCYAEFASMIPIAGSAYTYSYATMGELVAWIIGWDLILEYGICTSAVALGWAGYFNTVLNIIGFSLPAWMISDPYTGIVDPITQVQLGKAFINVPAVLIILVIAGLLAIGIKESATFNAIIVVIKVLAILFFIAIAIPFVKTVNWHPFMPFGWAGVGAGAALIFFAYIGFDAVSTTAEEAKNPQKDLPFGIIASLFICTILYIIVAAILTGIVYYPALNVAAPIAKGLNAIGKSWASIVISLGALCGITSVILVTMLGQSRIFFVMARDRLLPAGIAKVHPKFKTPFSTTLWLGIVLAALAAFFPIEEIAKLVNIGTLFAFVLVCGGIILLRKSQPEVKRGFVCPAVPWIPILGILFCVYLMLQLDWFTWLRFFGWLALGMLIYIFYSRHHSTLKDEEAPKEAEA